MKYIMKMLPPLYLLFLIAVAFPEEKYGDFSDNGEEKSEISFNIKFAREIRERMPFGVDSAFGQLTERIYCWSAVAGVEDTLTVFHIWNFEGKEQARVPIKITGSYFRAYSFQTIDSEQIGNWTVYIVDRNANLLGMSKFRIIPES